jgi:hypothetical protein
MGFTISWQLILFAKLHGNFQLCYNCWEKLIHRRRVFTKVCLSTMKKIPTLEKQFATSVTSYSARKKTMEHISA